jgi:hypothetical protein
MRTLLLCIAALCVAACAVTPAAPTVATPTAPAAPTTQPTPAPASRGAQLLSRSGQANAPVRADIEHAFGAADIARQDGAGLALTYRLNTCALLLVFAADANGAMRLADVHATARQPGQAAPTLQQCATEAEAHHS